MYKINDNRIMQIDLLNKLKKYLKKISFPKISKDFIKNNFE